MRVNANNYLNTFDMEYGKCHGNIYRDITEESNILYIYVNRVKLFVREDSM